jgi:hypothetical protein
MLRRDNILQAVFYVGIGVIFGGVLCVVGWMMALRKRVRAVVVAISNEAAVPPFYTVSVTYSTWGVSYTEHGVHVEHGGDLYVGDTVDVFVNYLHSSDVSGTRHGDSVGWLIFSAGVMWTAVCGILCTYYLAIGDRNEHHRSFIDSAFRYVQTVFDPVDTVSRQEVLAVK